MTTIEKFKQKWPNGFVGGEAIGLVGVIPLTLRWVNKDFTYGQKTYYEGDLVPIVRYDDKYIYISLSGSEIPVLTTSFQSFKIFNTL